MNVLRVAFAIGGISALLGPTFLSVGAVPNVADDGEQNSSPPTFRSQPSSIRAWEGQSARFWTSVSSSLPETYQWFSGSGPLVGATNSSLTLTNVQFSSAGAYYVRVQNSGGVTTSDVATLVVAPAPTAPGSGDRSFNPGSGANNGLNTVKILSDGKFMIGGALTEFNGTPRNGLAQLNSDGSLDISFDPGSGINGSVEDLLILPDNKILIGGSFSQYDGAPRSNLCRIRPDGSLDETFAAEAGSDSTIYTLARQSDGKIVIGGSFQFVAGEPSRSLARLNPDGTFDRTFISSSPNKTVYSVKVQKDDRIWIGGAFDLVGSNTRMGVARLLPDGSLDHEFNPGWGIGHIPTPQAVRWVLPLEDGTILAGGSITRSDDIIRLGLVRLTSTGAVDPTFSAAAGQAYVTFPDSTMAAALLPNGRVAIAGRLTEVNGWSRRNVTVLNHDGSMDPSFGGLDPVDGSSDTSSTSGVAIQADGKIVVVGTFTKAGGLPRNGIARFLGGEAPPAPPAARTITAASMPTSDSGKLQGQPSSIALQAGQDLILSVAAVSFEPVDYQWQMGSTSIPGATNPVLRLPNLVRSGLDPIRVLTRNSAGTQISGPVSVTVTNQTPQAGRTDLRFAPVAPIDGKVFSLLPQEDGKVLIGGGFIRIGQSPACLIARLHSDGRLDSFDPGWDWASGAAYALAKQGEQLLLGGNFHAHRRDGSGTDSHLVRLDHDGAVDRTFNPRLNSGAAIYSIVPRPGGGMAIGGEFVEVNGVSCQNLAVLRSDATLDSTFTAMANGVVDQLIWQPDGKLLLGGAFTTVNGTPRDHLARLLPNGALDPSFSAETGLDGEVYSLALQPDNQIIIGGAFSYAGNGKSVRGLARLNAAGQLDSSFSANVRASAIMDIAIQPDGKLIIAGQMTTVNGLLRSGLVRLNSNGAVDETFASSLDVTFSRYSREVPVGYKVALQKDGNILVGGYFNIAGGIHRARVARLYGATPAPEAPRLLSVLPNQTVRAGNNLLIAPAVESLWPLKYQWLNETNTVRSDAPGDQSFRRYSAVLADQGVYSVSAQSADNITNIGTSKITILPPTARAGLPDLASFTNHAANGTVDALWRQPDGRIWVGGGFTSYQGQPRRGLARLHLNGSLDESIDPSIRGPGRIRCLAIDNQDRLVAVGQIESNDGTRQGLVRLNKMGDADATFAVRLDPAGEVRALLLETNGDILLGGSFREINGAVRHHLARVHDDGSLHSAFENTAEPNGPVLALALDQTGGLWIGGDFTAVNAQPRAGFARLFPDGTLDPDAGTAFAIGGRVNAIVIRPNGQVLLGGHLSPLGDVQPYGVIQLGSDGQLDESGPHVHLTPVESEVFALSLQPDDKIVLAGNFSAVALGGITTVRHGLAQLQADATLELGFDPEAGAEGFRSEEAVRALVTEPDGNLLVAGGFNWMGGILRDRVARLVGTNSPTAPYTRLPVWMPYEYLQSSELREYRMPLRPIAPDSAAGALTFSLDAAPAGMAIDPVNGILTWTPTEAQGPSTNSVTARLHDRTPPGYESTVTFEFVILEVNASPVLESVPPQQLAVGKRFALQLQAIDPDLPANQLRFWLGRDAPVGSALDPATGEFTWTPAAAQAGVHQIEVVISDNAESPGQGVTSFTATVTAAASPPEFEVVSLGPNTLILSVRGNMGQTYDLESSLDLNHWELVQTVASQGEVVQVALNVSDVPASHCFYRLRQR